MLFQDSPKSLGLFIGFQKIPYRNDYIRRLWPINHYPWHKPTFACAKLRQYSQVSKFSDPPWSTQCNTLIFAFILFTIFEDFKISSPQKHIKTLIWVLSLSLSFSDSVPLDASGSGEIHLPYGWRKFRDFVPLHAPKMIRGHSNSTFVRGRGRGVCQKRTIHT